MMFLGLQNTCWNTHKFSHICSNNFGPRLAQNSVNHLLSYVKYIHCHTHQSAASNTKDIVIKKLLLERISLHKHRQMMDPALLLPPPNVRGMTELDREAFQKKVSVPHMIVKSSRVQCALKYLKKYLLKLENIKPVQCEEQSDKKVLLLNPLLVSKYEDIKDEFLTVYNGVDAEFEYRDITLKYENWKALETLKAILPENQEGAQSYSIIGHILHLNLRDHLLSYKSLIGQVFLDKIKNVSLVVNKTKHIESTYRNFQMEVLAGTGDTNVTVREAGCMFAMDFARVYWNPRLSTEHERIVKKLKHGDVLYDVMAGIGPFAIPAGKKKCNVLANDLNPYSYEALVKNCSINKVKDRVKCFNLDGHEFIKTILKKDLLQKWEEVSFSGDVHVTMNLPAMAVEFLPTYVGLFHNNDSLHENPTLPIIHVYMFTKEAKEDLAIGMVAERLGYSDKESESEMEETIVNGDKTIITQKDITDSCEVQIDKEILTSNNGEKTKMDNTCNKFGGLRKHIQETVYVRQVAPNKVMMRVSLRLPRKLLLKEPGSHEEPPTKKLKAV